MSKDKSIYWYASRLDKHDKKSDLFAYQQIPLAYWRSHPEQRGLMLAMEMGTGKTRPIAYMADEFEGEYVLFVSPKSLSEVVEQELIKIGKDPKRKSDKGIKRYHHISSNAGNLYTQWHAFLDAIHMDIMDITPLKGEQKKMRNEMHELNELYSDDSIIDVLSKRKRAPRPVSDKANILIIMDEAHLISQRIAHVLNKVHYSEKTDPDDLPIYKLYNEWKDSINVRFVMATGTPIPNEPFDLVPMINILCGRIYSPTGQYDYAFSDVYGKFFDRFVRTPNPHLFATRIEHLIYWYRIPRGVPDIPIPEISSEEVLKLPMEDAQWGAYLHGETKEELIERKIQKNPFQDGEPIVDSISVYRTFTRQACNMGYPNTYKKTKKLLDQLAEEKLDLPFIKQHSIKIYTILQDLFKNKDKIHAIYSHFVHEYGIELIEVILKYHKWESLNSLLLHNKAIDAKKFFSMTARNTNFYYATLTGEQTVELKSRILDIMNTQENATTKRIRCVLFSGASGHGITVYSVETFHKLEPDWNFSEEEQAQARFSRLFSAQFLPPSRRKLRVVRYLAVAPKNSSKMTADVAIHEIALRKKQRNIRILNDLASASISCKEIYNEENILHGHLIKQKIAPPMRIHFSCRSCNTELTSNIIMQESVEQKCDEIIPSPPKTAKSYEYMDTMYLLDPTTGLVWEKEDKILVVDPKLTRDIWIKYL